MIRSGIFLPPPSKFKIRRDIKVADIEPYLQLHKLGYHITQDHGSIRHDNKSVARYLNLHSHTEGVT